MSLPIPSLRLPEILRDSRNVRLLRLLRDDPRIGISELARQIGMSAPAVRERVQRLEDAGIIQGYRLDISPQALGYPLAAFVRQTCENCRTRTAPAPSGRVPSRHRRGLFHPENLPRRTRQTGRDTRPVSRLRPDDDITGAVHHRRAAHPAAARRSSRLRDSG